MVRVSSYGAELRGFGYDARKEAAHECLSEIPELLRAICPANPGWRKRNMLEGERVCFYLTEYSKEAARPILRRVLAGELFEAVAELYQEAIDTLGPVRKALGRSSKNPTRLKVKEGRAW